MAVDARAAPASTPQAALIVAPQGVLARDASIWPRGRGKQRATAARAEAVRGAIAETAQLSTRVAANMLNRRGITTASGKPWHAMQVLRARQRLSY